MPKLALTPWKSPNPIPISLAVQGGAGYAQHRSAVRFPCWLWALQRAHSPTAAVAQTASRDGIGELLKRAPDAATQMAQSQAGGQKAAPGTPHTPAPSRPRAREASRAREGRARGRSQLRAGAAPDEGRRRHPAGHRQEPRRGQEAARRGRLPHEAAVDRDARGPREEDPRPARCRLGIVTDVPVVDLQKKIEGLRKNIRELDDRIVRLREKQLTAPKDGVLPGYITDTVDSLGKDIEESKKRIEGNREEIAKAKAEVHEALNKAGIQLAPEQVDLLLDSVLSGDLVRLVAVFNSAKLIDGQLAR